MKNLRQSKDFRVFIFTVFNWFITLLTALKIYITNPSALVVVPFVMASLQALTKYINTTYFNDIWVTKPVDTPLEPTETL